MTVSASLSSPRSLGIFLFVRYLHLEKEGISVISKWLSSLLRLLSERVEWKPEVSGWHQTNVEVLVAAVWIATGRLFFSFLPCVHCLASCHRHEHSLQISHAGAFLHPTPACPRDFCIMNERFLNECYSWPSVQLVTENIRRMLFFFFFLSFILILVIIINVKVSCVLTLKEDVCRYIFIVGFLCVF